MPIEFIGDTRCVAAIRLAHTAAADGGEVGTEHLLLGLTHVAPGLKRILDGFDITPVVLGAVLRYRADRWNGPDGAELPDTEVTVAGDKRPLRFGYGATAALTRCMAQDGPTPRTPGALLTAILADEQSRAVTLITDCGVDLDEVRAAVHDGRAPTRNDPAREDPARDDPAWQDKVPADLRPVRDRLLGRKRYRGRGWRDRLLSSVIRVKINYAEAPVMWVSLESDEIARARGGRPRTDDLLLATVATYEVAAAYPHLMRAASVAYSGSRALVKSGATHARLAAAAASTDLGDEAVSDLLRRRHGSWPADTIGLLQTLLANEESRAVRLLRSLNIDTRGLV